LKTTEFRGPSSRGRVPRCRNSGI